MVRTVSVGTALLHGGFVQGPVMKNPLLVDGVDLGLLGSLLFAKGGTWCIFKRYG